MAARPAEHYVHADVPVVTAPVVAAGVHPPGHYRQPEQYLHGLHAPVVVVPARVAAWLGRRGLDSLRINARGVDAEVDDVLAALHLAGLQWRASVEPEAEPEVAGPQPEVAPALGTVMGTREAADLLGLTVRAVTLAIQQGRLSAERVGGRWRITRDDVEHYRAARAA